jgi:hypothetical protein
MLDKVEGVEDCGSSTTGQLLEPRQADVLDTLFLRHLSCQAFQMGELVAGLNTIDASHSRTGDGPTGRADSRLGALA